MIKFTDLSVFDCNTQAVINAVNCKGVMGKGIALEFKQKYHDNYIKYRKYCEDGKLTPGGLFITKVDDSVTPEYIVNFATKDEWWFPSQYGWIEDGLTLLHGWLLRRNIVSIACPLLGCGNGGLKVDKTVELIHNKLNNIDCEVLISQYRN